MRALILIVSCVIVLAIVQASYLVVDAHTSGPIIRVSDRPHQAAHRTPPHHKAQAQALKDTREHDQVTGLSPGGPSSRAPPPTTTSPASPPTHPPRDTDDHFRWRLLCQRRPEMARCRSADVGDRSAGAGPLNSRDSTFGETKTERKQETRPALPPTDVNVNETIRQILELAIDRKSQRTSGLYRQGAHHNKSSSHSKSTSSNPPPAKSFLMELSKGEQRPADSPSIPELAIRRGHRKELAYHSYADRNIRLHRQGCSSDHDCGTGCCLETRNGRRVCRRSGLRGVNKRCTSSCVCLPDLQCWVSENSVRHKPRKTRKLWGRCQDPTNGHLGEGHFIGATPNGQWTN